MLIMTEALPGKLECLLLTGCDYHIAPEGLLDPRTVR